jgi:acyl-CoA dehydrogenase
MQVSAKEKAFMENDSEKLCAISNDCQVYKKKDLPQPVWDYIRNAGILGTTTSSNYGGKSFSAHGHALMMQKLSSRLQSMGVSVVVPNSLLKRYGTKEQKDYFLSRLASGELIPCFDLTGPASGSDAAAMRDTAIVVEEIGKLGVCYITMARYITLARVAGCVGLAVKLKDPNGLLKGKGKEGISVFLLKRELAGLRVGPRHDPLPALPAFMNGAVEGESVWIPIDMLLGGQERANYCWNMLTDCLAEGRVTSLPAGAIAIGNLSVLAVGAYARLRKQFKVPTADLECAQEHLARIAGHTYITSAAQALINSMINQREQPAVISAVMKQQCTSRGRTTGDDAVGVLGGAGTCLGLANATTIGTARGPDQCFKDSGIGTQGTNYSIESVTKVDQQTVQSSRALNVETGPTCGGVRVATTFSNVSVPGAELARLTNCWCWSYLVFSTKSQHSELQVGHHLVFRVPCSSVRLT